MQKQECRECGALAATSRSRSGLCARCQHAALLRLYRECRDHDHRVRPLPPEVDPTRESRLLLYQTRASARQPLFS